MKMICVDDEELVLELVKDACLKLPQQPEVFAFTEAAGALDFIIDHKVDIALLDIRMPEMDGLTLAQKVKEASPDTAIEERGSVKNERCLQTGKAAEKGPAAADLQQIFCDRAASDRADTYHDQSLCVA